jgi:Ser/Thr protein kinase RdoA (MazF antagonist)
MQAVLDVLSRYPAVLRPGALEPLGNRGGFSGARLWRLATPAGPLCLRASGPAETAHHLAWRHRLMALAKAPGHPFVPTVLATSDGATFVEQAGRCWELMEWLAGQADYRDDPSPARLEAAARALALVHDCWRREGHQLGVCPAVVRRLELVRAWREPVLLAGSERLGRLAAQMRDVVCRRLPQVPGLLGPWLAKPCQIQPCLRDVWHDHLLFEGQRLTGLVDYAAAGPDSVAADLARMLGSLVEDDEKGWAMALAAYRNVRELSREEEQLARALDWAGTIICLANWLRWLAEGGHTDQAIEHAVGRMQWLLDRARRMGP